MKRYFMVHDDNVPTIKELKNFGVYHYIELDSHGPAGHKWNLFCIVDEAQPKPGWLSFPPIYDSKTTLAQSPVLHEALEDIGLTGEETCVEAIVKLGEIHPGMGF